MTIITKNILQPWLEKYYQISGNALSNGLLIWEITILQLQLIFLITFIVDYILTLIIYNLYTHINKKLYEYFPSITWFIIISEYNKKGRPHLHLLVAIRNFIDYNHNLRNNLKSRLVRCVNLYDGSYDETGIDIKVESLLYFKDIKNWVIYLHKDYSI